MNKKFLALIAVSMWAAGCSDPEPVHEVMPCERAGYVLVNGTKCKDSSCEFDRIKAEKRCPPDYPFCAQDAGGTEYCRAACDAGMAFCSNTCIDPMNNDKYCGADENCTGYTSCSEGQMCKNGICTAEKVECGGKMINPMVNPRYCGAKADCTGYEVCSENEICFKGSCILKNAVMCGGRWIDPDSDSKYCGANVNCTGYTSCGDDQFCYHGVCAEYPSVTYVDCGGIKCVEGYCLDGVCSRTCKDYPEECGNLRNRCDDINNCRSDPDCNGVGKCTAYTCGEKNTCQWPVCRKSPACEPDNSGCDIQSLPPDGDWDKDGIINRIEMQSEGLLNPCSADTDGDGVPDNLEDINGDGMYQPLYGETDPSNPASTPGPDGVSLQLAVCSSENNLLHGTTERLPSFNVAAPRNITTGKELIPDIRKNGIWPSAVHYDDPAGLAIMFAMDKNGITGKKLLSSENVKKIVSGYYEISNFTYAVPLSVWKESGFYNPGLQGVPNHEVTRFTYDVTLRNGRTLEEFRNAISNAINPTEGIPSMAVQTRCKGGKIRFALTRSRYYDKMEERDFYLYSGAAACADHASAIVHMSDIASGTLISPKGGYDAPKGYSAYDNFVCEMQNLSKSTSKVDFIWVLDNSGSMGAEQEKLSLAADTLIKRLSSSGIDYRMGVSGTDAYLLDEWNAAYDNAPDSSDNPYFPFYNAMDENGVITGAGEFAKSDPYYGYTGLRPVGPMHNRMRLGECMAVSKMSERFFADAISENISCRSDRKNLCGRGFEDGLSSGLTVLQRLQLDASGPIAGYAHDLEKRRKSNWAFSRSSASALESNCSGGVFDETNADHCAKVYESCAVRDDALQYIIWVSDEESRQFKEQPEKTKDGKPIVISNDMLTPFDADAVQDAVGDAVVIGPEDAAAAHLVGCMTGYKLVNLTQEADKNSLDFNKLIYSMKSGSWLESYSYKDCNPPLAQKLKMLVGSRKLTEDTPLSEIRNIFPEYYDMLMYYIKSYRQNASKAGIAGFAIVGDIGKANGGSCAALSDNLETDGADYGLSYIHMAKYMSAVADDGRLGAKGGGFASICNTSYENIIDEIFDDVSGRLSKYALRGYPIASTISAAIQDNDRKRITLLKKGSEWTYDASQNAVILHNPKALSSGARLGISYAVWTEVED